MTSDAQTLFKETKSKKSMLPKGMVRLDSEMEKHINKNPLVK